MMVGEIDPSVRSAFGAIDASTITIFILDYYYRLPSHACERVALPPHVGRE